MVSIGAPKLTFAPASPGSRLISGDSPALNELEHRIARFHGFPSATLFNSGYTANLGLLGCLGRRTDTIIYDELIHASLRDGIRLSGAAARRCQHNLEGEFNQAIAAARPDGQRFLVTESRFSMDGDTAPLTELAGLCERSGAHLIVDEAHSFGLDGASGKGLVAELGLQPKVFATVVTYGKAGGYHGAAVLGGHELKDYLINFCRPLIYTTASGAEQVAGVNAVYDRLEDEHGNRHNRLQRVIQYFRTAVTDSEIATYASGNAGPIQTVNIAGNDRVMEAEKILLAAGILVKGIRGPTVPAGKERLRICLHAFNTESEVDRLLGALRDAGIFAA